MNIMKTLISVFALMLLTFTQVLSQNHSPVAVNDTVYGFVGYPVYLNMLKNDYDPDGDSIYVLNGPVQLNDSTWVIETNDMRGQPYNAVNKLSYVIKDTTGLHADGFIMLYLRGTSRYDFLDINNISALISPFGNHFWDFGNSEAGNIHGLFEVPKGSGKTAVFNQTFWIGGKDNIDTLHFAGERYRLGLSYNFPGLAKDFSAGPISQAYDTSYLLNWNRVWKLKKTEIQYHMNNWNTPGYAPLDAIANWPAHGDVALGQMRDIAPYYDYNADNNYDPMAGDYPLIRGDETVFFVFNDSAQMHTETYGLKVGVEIHAMAYAFDNPEDSVLNNTIFFHYDIINRSQIDYQEAYMGVFTDFDLGYYGDDYIGCDVKNGSVYIYNGKPIDGNGESWAYGAHPPVLAMKIIGGPFLEADNLDNPSGGCDYSINGLNFGNEIVDDERLGLQGFLYYSNNSGSNGDPKYANEYYNYLRGIWKDGSHLLFGGIECKYMFPGGSDTICNWGTGGVLPGGGWNQNGLYWTELTSGNPPEDRRGIASVGPFAMAAGQSIPLDYCFNYSRDYTSNQQSAIEIMQSSLSGLNQLYDSLIMLPGSINGVEENENLKQIRIYPNPARGTINVVSAENKSNTYQVYDLNGRLQFAGILNPGKNQINISSLRPGVYLLKSNNRYARIVVM